jgi:hypothetical protein
MEQNPALYDRLQPKFVRQPLIPRLAATVATESQAFGST